MTSPSMAQAAAFGRHVATYAAGAVSALAVLNVISAGDAATLSASVNQISSGVAQIAAGLAPIIGLVSAFYAAHTASPAKQIASVNAMPGVMVVGATAPIAANVSQMQPSGQAKSQPPIQ